MSKKKAKKAGDNTIAQNKKAFHDYLIEEKFEAGIALEGWEVKSLREGRVQLVESYVLIKAGEAFLIGTHIPPLQTASTHIHPAPMRTRKLLLHRREINRLIGQIEQRGYTVVALALYWKHNKVKVSLGLAKGKKSHDKRAASKDRDWQRDKERLMKKDQ